MKAILFVDDHEILARLSCEILEMQGYRAVSAFNAADALQKFKQSPFDMVVTDFRMEGMNGLELARKIHEEDPQVPVIVVTGFGPIETGKEVRACLSKEDMFPTLLNKIKEYFAESNEPEESEEDAVRSA
ncbi:MAG TPA: response regulator [Terriglobales bacterium]